MSEMLIRVAPGSTGAIELAGERLRAIDPGADVAIASVASRLRGETGRPRTLALPLFYSPLNSGQDWSPCCIWRMTRSLTWFSYNRMIASGLVSNFPP